ncbi:hypothetical protein FB451DRAFT_1565271 [Mycena latifolia]|nr:hypothetical protein FB451DRAFT_1565271 [Mycena latifolia]
MAGRTSGPVTVVGNETVQRSDTEDISRSPLIARARSLLNHRRRDARISVLLCGSNGELFYLSRMRSVNMRCIRVGSKSLDAFITFPATSTPFGRQKSSPPRIYRVSPPYRASFLYTLDIRMNAIDPVALTEFRLRHTRIANVALNQLQPAIGWPNAVFLPTSQVSGYRMSQRGFCMSHALKDGKLEKCRPVTNAEGPIYMHTAGTKLVDDRASGVIDEDTVLWLCSQPKMITTIAALQLIDQDKITLDTPVDTVLPELADPVVVTAHDGAPEHHGNNASNNASLRAAQKYQGGSLLCLALTHRFTQRTTALCIHLRGAEHLLRARRTETNEKNSRRLAVAAGMAAGDSAEADQIAFHIYTKLFHVLHAARASEQGPPSAYLPPSFIPSVIREAFIHFGMSVDSVQLGDAAGCVWDDADGLGETSPCFVLLAERLLASAVPSPGVKSVSHNQHCLSFGDIYANFSSVLVLCPDTFNNGMSFSEHSAPDIGRFPPSQG